MSISNKKPPLKPPSVEISSRLPPRETSSFWKCGIGSTLTRCGDAPFVTS
jgi:hypothetical protein